MSRTPAPDLPSADQNDPNSSIALEPTFELLLTLTYLPKHIWTANRKTKFANTKAINFSVFLTIVEGVTVSGHGSGSGKGHQA